MVFLSTALTITGNDPGSYSGATIVISIILTIGGCFLNANIFGTISNILQQIKEKESNPDFFSAIRLCKKRRIGPSREENNRSLFYKKDISILARSGFSYELSKKILNIPKDEFIKFCKMI